DRGAEGGHGASPGPAEPAAVGPGDVSAGIGGYGAPEDALYLRRFGVGAVLAADRGCAAGVGEAGWPPRSSLSGGPDREGEGDGRPFRAFDAAGISRRSGDGRCGEVPFA